MMVSGACLCGQLSFQASAPPRRVTHCHCDMCRRSVGAVVATFATFESDKVAWQGELSRFDSSDRGWRGFCACCGSSVCFGYKPRPERIYIALGIFHSPENYPAGFHDYRSEKLKWLQLDEGLPDATGASEPSSSD